MWRKTALEMLPELESIISSADNPFRLWIDLMFALEEAYESSPQKENIISNAYRFARWCRDYPSSLGDDLHQAVYINFFQGLPRHPLMRADIARRMSPAEMEDLLGEFLFAFYGTKEQDSLLRDLFGARGPEVLRQFERKLRRARESTRRKS
jgi:hypothetical protein